MLELSKVNINKVAYSPGLQSRLTKVCAIVEGKLEWGHRVGVQVEFEPCYPEELNIPRSWGENILYSPNISFLRQVLKLEPSSEYHTLLSCDAQHALCWGHHTSHGTCTGVRRQPVGAR